jgi:hypothetical protein
VVSWVSMLLFGMAGLLPQSAQTPKTVTFLPSVSISLPADVLSETVQISYFLVGRRVKKFVMVAAPIQKSLLSVC